MVSILSVNSLFNSAIVPFKVIGDSSSSPEKKIPNIDPTIRAITHSITTIHHNSILQINDTVILYPIENGQKYIVLEVV